MNADSFGFVGRGTSALHLKKNLEHEGISMNVANGLLVDGQMMIRSTESNINMRVGDLFFFFFGFGKFCLLQNFLLALSWARPFMFYSPTLYTPTGLMNPPKTLPWTPVDHAQRKPT